ncbi:MAG: DHH family phosphoesterase, partial [Lachnospiraceae bacterium]|nr:DHH family phosphoesterase [Lachnospiraceae bacterium]
MITLEQLEQYEPITIQCHDNPDGDAIASGFGLYTYFKEKGKDVRLIYSGRNRIKKANLTLMLSLLDIPITHVEPQEEPIEGLLITVDCQYGAGNVTKLPAEQVAIIDHHQVEITDVKMCRIEPTFGSCSTLVWKMFLEAGYRVTNMRLGTALYYGLYT